MQQGEVIATISASPGRRWLGIMCMATLGVLVITIGFFRPPGLGLTIFLLVIGAASLWAATAMQRATAHTIELTATELRDTSGEVLAELENIQSIDRGVFAFKPSNGFLLRLKQPATRLWRPGLWWRFGRQVGVGGMTPGPQTKFVAEYIGKYIAQRDTTKSKN